MLLLVLASDYFKVADIRTLQLTLSCYMLSFSMERILSTLM